MDANKAKALWKEVRERMDAKEMPPSTRKQPTATERITIMAWLGNILSNKGLAGVQDPGKPILRRLTRLEYNNTVRDLLGLETDLFMFPERLPFKKDYIHAALAKGRMPTQFRLSAIQYGARFPALLKQAGLPGDNRAEHGFTNRGDALNLSPLLLEKYLAVANEIFDSPALPYAITRHQDLFKHLQSGSQNFAGKRRLIPLPAVKEFAPRNNVQENAQDLKKFRRNLAEAIQNGRGGVCNAESKMVLTLRRKQDALAVAFGSKKTLLLIPDRPLWLANFSSVRPVSGNMIFTNRGKGNKSFTLSLVVSPSGGKAEGVTHCGIVVLSRKNQQGKVRLIAEFSNGKSRQISHFLKPGPNVANTFFSFSAPPKEHITQLRIDGSKFSGDFLVLDDFAFMTAPRAKSSGNTASTQTQNRQGFKNQLTPFLSHAFRQPVSDEKVEQYLRPYDYARKRGLPHHLAAKASLTAVLASPEFLYLIEKVDPKKGPVRKLNAYELAARLSYFLWSSIPDDELNKLASQGKLQDPEIFEQQVRRMLRDPKSRELTNSFAVQWLHLNQLWAARPDRKDYPSYYYGPTGTLAQHMMAEAVLLFETVHVEDRSILEFIDSRYTYLNGRLMKHYQLDPEDLKLDADKPKEEIEVAKDLNNPWFRVRLADRNRGGFLTSGAVLTLTSMPKRTSPVKRGAWVLEAIFNRPPPPPNVAVEPLDANPKKTAGKTVRQKLELHRTDASCISCHSKIDPPGFALENFDAVGRWRDRDGVFAVDSSGVLPDGRKFSGPVEFKNLILKKNEGFVRGFVEQMLSYSLARKLEYFDDDTVQEIAAAVAKDDFRCSRVEVEIA